MNSGKTVNTENVHYYYVRTSENHPIGVVAVYQHSILNENEEGGTLNKVFCRGISICNKNDRWDKWEGRKRALANLKKAVGTHSSKLPIFRKSECEHLPIIGNLLQFWESKQIKGMTLAPFDILYASQYDIFLTPYEHRLMFKPE